MNHDFTKYFDTDNEYWDKLQELYKANDSYPKVIVHNRELHHKFMRCFSRKEGIPVDNDKDNLVSLSLGDHFLAHFYIWKCTKKGFRQYTARPVSYMYKKAFSSLTEESALLIRDNWDNAKKKFSNPKLAEFNHTRKGKKQTEEHKAKVRSARQKYDMPLVNIVTLEKTDQRNQKRLHLDEKTPIANNRNLNPENIWIRQKEIEKINRMFNIDFLSISTEDRVNIIISLSFIKSYYKDDPTILDRIKEELDKWHY